MLLNMEESRKSTEEICGSRGLAWQMLRIDVVTSRASSQKDKKNYRAIMLCCLRSQWLPATMHHYARTLKRDGCHSKTLTSFCSYYRKMLVMTVVNLILLQSCRETVAKFLMLRQQDQSGSQLLSLLLSRAPEKRDWTAGCCCSVTAQWAALKH